MYYRSETIINAGDIIEPFTSFDNPCNYELIALSLSLSGDIRQLVTYLLGWPAMLTSRNHEFYCIHDIAVDIE